MLESMTLHPLSCQVEQVSHVILQMRNEVNKSNKRSNNYMIPSNKEKLSFPGLSSKGLTRSKVASNGCDDTRAMQDEIEDLHNQKNQLIMKLSQQKRESDGQISQLKMQNSLLDDKLLDTQGQLKLALENEKSLKNQIAMLIDENRTKNEEINNAQEKISKKKDQIAQLKVATKKTQMKLQESEMQKKRYQIEISSQRSMLQQSQMSIVTEDKNESENATTINMLSNQVKSLLEENQKAATMMEHYAEENGSLKLQISEEQKMSNDLNYQIQNIQDELEVMKNNFDECSQKLEARGEEITKLRSTLIDVLDVVGKYQQTDVEELPAVIDSLINDRESETEKDEKINQLGSIINCLTRFIIKLLMDNTVSTELITNPSKPIQEDEDISKMVTHSISQIKEFVKETCPQELMTINIFDSLLSAKDHYFSDNVPAELSTLTVLCAANERVCKYYKNLMEQIKTIQELYKIKSSNNEPIEDIIQYLKRLNITMNKLMEIMKTTLHYQGNGRDIINLIDDYITETSELIHSLDKNVRPIIEFRGDIVNIPESTADYILDLRNKMLNIQQESAQKIKAIKQECEQKTLEVQDQFVTNKKKSFDQIKEIESLKEKNIQLTRDHQKLIQQCETFKKTQIEHEKTIKNMQARIDEYEQSMSMAQLEKERYQGLIDERSKYYNNRINELVESEKQRHEEALKRQDKITDSKITDLEAKIQSLNKKIKRQKQQNLDVIRSYEETIQKQKVMMRQFVKHDSCSDIHSQVLSANYEELNEFIQQIGSIYRTIVPKVNTWSKKSIIETTQYIVSTVMKHSDQNWIIWASRLLNVQSKKHYELQQIIETKLKINRENIKSLRLQKRILLNSDINTPTNQSPNFRSLLGSVLFIFTVKTHIKNNRAAQKKSSHLKTPTKL